MVEQNAKAALALADRALILVEGRTAHEGTAADIAADPSIGAPLSRRRPPARCGLNLQFLADGLIMGALIGLGADRRHPHLFDPAASPISPMASSSPGAAISRSRSRRRLTGSFGTDRRRSGRLSFGWPVLVAGVLACDPHRPAGAGARPRAVREAARATATPS